MLTGKTAIITGGSRGIGAAISIKLARCRADVAVIYSGNADMAQDICETARQYGVRAESFCCDVSDFSSAKKTVAKIIETFGTADILVNNAGITRDGLILTMKEEAFDDVVAINLKGTFNMIRHCAPVFIKKRTGKIINISSVAGLTGNAGQVNYSASKAGIIGLTKSAARELATRNICCNAIAPGFIKTDMTQSIAPDNPLMSAIPLGRIGRAEEVAELTAFLCTADYITGEIIRIDGGMAM